MRPKRGALSFGCLLVLALGALLPAGAGQAHGVAAAREAFGGHTLLGNGVTYGPGFSTSGATLTWRLEWSCAGGESLHVNLEKEFVDKYGPRWEYFSKITRFDPLPSPTGGAHGTESLERDYWHGHETGGTFRISLHAVASCHYGIQYTWP